MKKPNTVHETVCVQAKVTIMPNVDVGEIQSHFLGGPKIGPCAGEPSTMCSFIVSQRICVEVPLSFSTTAVAEPGGIVCGDPAIGPCSPTPVGCTRTLGYYRNNPDVTDALIAAAGGSIILGTGSDGLSFNVTSANANLVLTLNTPTPPAPSSPPFAPQYQVLYAQLLTARLNVLNGAECDFAHTAIEAANAFLATSPSGGKAGAPALQEQLAEYNEGSAAGCPGHCDE